MGVCIFKFGPKHISICTLKMIQGLLQLIKNALIISFAKIFTVWWVPGRLFDKLEREQDIATNLWSENCSLADTV